VGGTGTRGPWSSSQHSRGSSSKHRGNTKQANTTEAGLLSTKLRKHHRERKTATSNQLSTSFLKLWTKPRQELIDSLKLQIKPHSPATRTGTTNSRAKRVKLMPNSRTLCVELLNTRITLLESMFLMDHRQVEGVTRGLIPLAKMIPHLRSSRKSHKLRGKLW
jgi:hypothetical protein